MNAQELIESLATNTDNSASLARQVEKDPSLIPELLDGTKSSQVKVKYRCLKVLNLLSRTAPDALYPHCDYFVNLMENPNNIFKWNALDILANLTTVDREDKLLPLFQKYYDKLKEGNLITAAHVVENSAVIVAARPEREREITGILAGVETIALPTEECRNILRGKVIETYDRYFEKSKSQKTMLQFARSQLYNTRPATRKKAEDFLRKRAASVT